MNTEYPNVFEGLKDQFKIDTGKIWKDNIELYCQYVLAKNSTTTMQMLVDIRNYLAKIEAKIPIKR